MKRVKRGLRSLVREESGQDLLEYAFIVALLALASIVALGNLRGSISQLLNAVGSVLRSAT